jgi:uncharacterized cupin superfamily protein
MSEIIMPKIDIATIRTIRGEVGSRHPDDLIRCSDIDMMSANADGRFVHKDGTPYEPS